MDAADCALVACGFMLLLGQIPINMLDTFSGFPLILERLCNALAQTYFFLLAPLEESSRNSRILLLVVVIVFEPTPVILLRSDFFLFQLIALRIGTLPSL